MKNGKEAIVATLCEQEEKLIKRAGMSQTMRGFCSVEFAQAAGCRGTHTCNHSKQRRICRGDRVPY